MIRRNQDTVTSSTLRYGGRRGRAVASHRDAETEVRVPGGDGWVLEPTAFGSMRFNPGAAGLGKRDPASA